MAATLFKKLEWRLKRQLGYQDALIRAEIEQSGYFHSEWYLANYPELLNDPSAVKDPLGYHLAHGISQMHNPGPGFHTQWYLDEYDDVRGASINPLLHYLRFGRHEDRRPTPFLGGVQSMLYKRGGTQHRVIYKTRRSTDLSHIGRIKRLDSQEGVQTWRGFSRAFRAQQGNLAQQEAEYLHNRGFLPNRKRLYKLPDTRVDAYISDLQASLLAQTNGAMQAALLENTELQWQLYNHRIPMVANPETTKQVQPAGHVIKVILIMDPAGAGLVPLSVVATKKATAATVGMARSMQLSPNSGRTRSVARFNSSGTVVGPRRPMPWEKYRYKAAWQQANTSIVMPIQKESLYSFVQVDIDVSAQTPLLIRLAATPTIEDFQVHGPLMQNQTAIDFMREFGI